MSEPPPAVALTEPGDLRGGVGVVGQRGRGLRQDRHGADGIPGLLGLSSSACGVCRPLRPVLLVTGSRKQPIARLALRAQPVTPVPIGTELGGGLTVRHRGHRFLSPTITAQASELRKNRRDPPSECSSSQSAAKRSDSKSLVSASRGRSRSVPPGGNLRTSRNAAAWRAGGTGGGGLRRSLRERRSAASSAVKSQPAWQYSHAPSPSCRAPTETETACSPVRPWTGRRRPECRA